MKTIDADDDGDNDDDDDDDGGGGGGDNDDDDDGGGGGDDDVDDGDGDNDDDGDDGGYNDYNDCDDDDDDDDDVGDDDDDGDNDDDGDADDCDGDDVDDDDDDDDDDDGVDDDDDDGDDDDCDDDDDDDDDDDVGDDDDVDDDDGDDDTRPRCPFVQFPPEDVHPYLAGFQLLKLLRQRNINRHLLTQNSFLAFYPAEHILTRRPKPLPHVESILQLLQLIGYAGHHVVMSVGYLGSAAENTLGSRGLTVLGEVCGNFANAINPVLQFSEFEMKRLVRKENIGYSVELEGRSSPHICWTAATMTKDSRGRGAWVIAYQSSIFSYPLPREHTHLFRGLGLPGQNIVLIHLPYNS